MAATDYTPITPNSYYWDTTVTTYRGSPVVVKPTGNNPYMVTNPAGTSADIIVGVAEMDAGPGVPAAYEPQAANVDVITVKEVGVVAMYAKGAITQGQMVKIGPAISVTPAGYPSPITVYTAQAATQTAAGAQPYPVLGIAITNASQDGDVVYVLLRPDYY
jgi:hypothetical protein